MVSRSAVLLSSRCETYGAGGILLLGALAVDLEGDTVGGGALDLKGSSRGVVEVLVQQLYYSESRQLSLILNKKTEVRRYCRSEYLTSLDNLAMSEKAGMAIFAVFEGS